MISFGERCYTNQYDEISYDEISDDEIFGDEISASHITYYATMLGNVNYRK